MQQEKHIRRTTAILLSAVMMLAVALTPVTIQAAEGGNDTYNASGLANDDEYAVAEGENSYADDGDYIAYGDEYNITYGDEHDMTDTLALLEESLYWGEIDINGLNLTGNFHNLRLVSIENGMALAVISQYAESSAFFATSTNLTDWEIKSPAADWYVYHYGRYYWYANGLHRTTDWRHDWQIHPPHDGHGWDMSWGYILDNFEDINQLPNSCLQENGVLRIERLPFIIDEQIRWVGFAVTEGTSGGTYRRQLRLFAGSVWLNPLPEGAMPALPGLEDFGWAHGAVEFVVARNLMDMYYCQETNEPIAFNPTSRAARGEVLAAAVVALELTAPSYPDIYHIPFADVPLSGRGVYIDIAKQLGLVAGIGNNQFAPAHTISRQDMMTMLYNILLAMGQIAPDTELTALRRFNDAGQIAEYARLPISSLARAGIIAGDGLNINPAGYMTRVEAAMFVYSLYRVSER